MRPSSRLTCDRTRVPRPQRAPRRTGGADRRRHALRAHRRRPRSVRRAAAPGHGAAGRERAAALRARRSRWRGSGRALAARYRRADVAEEFERVTDEWDAVLGTLDCRDARRRDELHAQSLAALSDARLPAVRARRLLPGGRRLRLSRSVAGRDGADGRSTRGGARAHRSRMRAPVSGGRRPALVASAVGTRCPDAFLRRSRVPAVRRRALRRDDGRCRRARRDRAVHRRTAGARRSGKISTSSPSVSTE